MWNYDIWETQIWSDKNFARLISLDEKLSIYDTLINQFLMEEVVQIGNVYIIKLLTLLHSWKIK